MANTHCTSSSIISETFTYPLPVNRTFLRVAEDSGEYSPVNEPAVSVPALRAFLKQRLQDKGSRLSPRLQHVLSEFIRMELSKEEGTIDLFSLLVRLILQADEEPARILAGLMAGIDNDALEQTGGDTISGAAAFIRDYLARETVLYLLANRDG